MKFGGEGSASGPRLRGILNSSHAEAAQPRPACATFSEENYEPIVGVIGRHKE